MPAPLAPLQGVYCVPNSATKLGYTTGSNLCLKSCNSKSDCEEFFFYIQGTDCVSDPSVSFKFCYFPNLIPLSDTTVTGSSVGGGGASVWSFDLGGPYDVNPYQMLWLPAIAIVVSGLAPGQTATAQLTQGSGNAYIAVNFDHEWPFPQGDSVQVTRSERQTGGHDKREGSTLCMSGDNPCPWSPCW